MERVRYRKKQIHKEDNTAKSRGINRYLGRKGETSQPSEQKNNRHKKKAYLDENTLQEELKV